MLNRYFMLIEKYNFTLEKIIAIMLVMIMIPISIGIIGAESSGVSYLKFIPNIIGSILGLLLFTLVLKFTLFLHKYIFEVSLLALLCLMAVFMFEGIETVFRWIKIGPILIHISSIIIPLLLYNYFKLEKITPYKAFFPIVIASFILFLQPDAGQSLALFFAMLPFLPRNIQEIKTISLWIIITLLSIIVWIRLDPLMPVQHVENIFVLISELQPFGEILVVISIVSIFSSIVFVGNLRSKLTLSILLYFFEIGRAHV